MPGTATRIAQTIRMTQELDSQWMRNPAGHEEPRSTPWMPFPLFDFIALVAEALPESQGTRFLEVGAGIGTRMLLAQEIFGLDVRGIERVPEYVRQAAQLNLDVEEADALGWKDYGSADIIWFNRPFLDPVPQGQLEEQVWNDVAPGTVVICANLNGTPPTRGWYLILDDAEVRRWIWQKL